ncbi:MAG: FtsH protease activity modulator HflK, partial [Vicinamibacterales bacterium]
AAAVGIAFGHGASDLSADAAGVVVLDAALARIPTLLEFAHRTLRRVFFNVLVFAVGVNIAAVVAAGLGYLTPVASAILHQIVSLTVIASSASLLVAGGLPGGLDPVAWRKAALDRVSVLHGRVLPPFVARARRERRRLTQGAVAVVALAWAVSGVTVVRPGETAVVQRFGRLVNPALPPGVHVRAPWPIDVVTRERPQQVRELDIGFRSPKNLTSGPVDLEWNTSHAEGGPVQEVPDENLTLTGDENLVELYAVVQYRVANPSRYIFGVRDGDALVRTLAEGALRAIGGSYTLERLLTTDRRTFEGQWADEMRRHLAQLDVGVDVLGIYLADVHPPVDVVSAFRDVAAAQQDELVSVLEAEAYVNEQVPHARGTAQADLAAAAGYRTTRIDDSEGDAARFLEQISPPSGTAPLTQFRLEVETLEAVLPDRQLTILDDHSGGKRTIMTLENRRDLLTLLSPDGGDQDPFRP